MKEWIAEYNGDKIRIVNHAFEELLFVNDQLQDKHSGMACSIRLFGQLTSGESIKVSLGGFATIECVLFVDHKEVKVERLR